MKSTGILFQADMIRALLRTQNPKTQTRRIIDPQPPAGWALTGNYGRITSAHPKKGKFGAFIRRGMDTDFPQSDIIPCRFGAPGDELWAKETFLIDDYRFYPSGRLPKEKPDLTEHQILYRANGTCCEQLGECDCEGKGSTWRPSIFMPRWASRITLVIDNIRAERVSAISHLDALAEGLEPGPHRQRAYRDLWNRINAKPQPVYGRDDADARKFISYYIAYPWAVEDMEQVPGVTDIQKGTKDWDYVADYRRYALVIKPDPYVWAITFHRKN